MSVANLVAAIDVKTFCNNLPLPQLTGSNRSHNTIFSYTLCKSQFKHSKDH